MRTAGSSDETPLRVPRETESRLHPTGHGLPASPSHHITSNLTGFYSEEVHSQTSRVSHELNRIVYCLPEKLDRGRHTAAMCLQPKLASRNDCERCAPARMQVAGSRIRTVDDKTEHAASFVPTGPEGA